MHTVKVLGGGFVLLLVCLLLGRMAAASPAAGTARAALVFLPLWLVGAGVNMWIGVRQAGYPVSEEAPVFLVVFGLPALVALATWWRFRR